MNTVLIAESGDSWLGTFDGVEVVDPRDYLETDGSQYRRGTRIYNLSRSYGYQTIGYYVSLLAEARGHRPIPGVLTMQDLHGSSAIRLVPLSLEELIQKSLHSIAGDRFTLSVYFGENLAKKHSKLAQELYVSFQAPLLRFEFKRGEKWRLRNASAIALKSVPEQHRGFVADAARRHFAGRNSTPSKRRVMRYDLAILHNPDERDLAPSDDAALKRFAKAAAECGIAAELITRKDSGRLLEFDALFIRETTAVNHHTYRMARRAQAAGMVVIDDPLSILRCSNKVYLAELLNRARIPMPRTWIVHRGNAQQVASEVSFPVVLKRPDSAFSQGVVKASDECELQTRLAEFFEDSELVIAQQYLRTDFDWRIGVLDGRALFACKYHMAKGHWQIAKQCDADDGPLDHTSPDAAYSDANGSTTIKTANNSAAVLVADANDNLPADDVGKHSGGKPTPPKLRFGKCETFPVETAPRKAVAMAVKAADLIGKGLYGVDVKEVDGNFLIIEVNDNPNLNSGVEDAVLRDELYRRIAESFLRRIESTKQ